MAKAKYPVSEYVGVPVEQDQSGQYVIKDQTDFQLHSWRTGRHTKGKFKQLGQVFLTENGLSVAVVATHPWHTRIVMASRRCSGLRVKLWRMQC